MRDVFIIEKGEIVGLSVLVAERIIQDLEKFYGYTMVARDGGKVADNDVILGFLASSINRALRGLEK